MLPRKSTCATYLASITRVIDQLFLPSDLCNVFSFYLQIFREFYFGLLRAIEHLVLFRFLSFLPKRQNAWWVIIAEKKLKRNSRHLPLANNSQPIETKKKNPSGLELKKLKRRTQKKNFQICNFVLFFNENWELWNKKIEKNGERSEDLSHRRGWGAGLVAPTF